MQITPREEETISLFFFLALFSVSLSFFTFFFSSFSLLLVVDASAARLPLFAESYVGKFKRCIEQKSFREREEREEKRRKSERERERELERAPWMFLFRAKNLLKSRKHDDEKKGMALR